MGTIAERYTVDTNVQFDQTKLIQSKIKNASQTLKCARESITMMITTQWNKREEPIKCLYAEVCAAYSI